MKQRRVNGKSVELRQGKLLVDGEHVFLKIGKPLRNFGSRAEIEQLMRDLEIIQSKNYNCIELNCYWHHLDRDGDGLVDVDLEPLVRLIDEINARGMFACLSVETYGVGGGQIPDGFWEANPGNIAVGIDGHEVSDTEFGYMSKVPSLYSAEYLRLSRSYITDLTSRVDASKILYFETTVEPQYMGDVWIDYSDRAREAYGAWLVENQVDDARPFPSTFPVDEAFVHDPTWNRFRAEWLAEWVSGDARAFRAAAGADAWVACDYLDPEESTVVARNGDPITFLNGLGALDIIQVNWHWHYGDRAPNLKAYQRVRQVNEATGRDWVIAEHMTINGTDYHAEEMEGLLTNTIRNSTHFGWEFVDIEADPDGPEVPEGEVLPGMFKPAHFSVYDKDWNPKPSMAVVDDQWDRWMEEVRIACGQPAETVV